MTHHSKGVPAAKSTDGTGERQGTLKNGVAMGQKDSCAQKYKGIPKANSGDCKGK